MADVLLAGWLITGCYKAGCLFDLACWAIGPGKNWLPNLCLAGNPVTWIPDFVQPWQTLSTEIGCEIFALAYHFLLVFGSKNI